MSRRALAEVEQQQEAPVGDESAPPPKKTRRRITLAAIVGVLLVVGLLAGIKVSQIRSMINVGKNFVPPPEAVATAKVEATTWQAARSAIGSVVAIHGGTLGSEVTGMVRKIDFDSGMVVKKGQVLVRLDTSYEQAQLQSARADAQLAKLTLNRTVTLSKNGAVTTAELEAAEARAKQTDAAVSSLEATIAKKTIRAPFDGRVAIRQVELGQVLSPGTAIASVQSVSPIYVEFSLPQQSLSEVKVGQKVRVRADIFPGASWEGEVSVINPEVDVATRNVRIRGTFENTDGRLTPGMFVNVEVLSHDKQSVTLIPATAVIFAPYGDSVFAVEEKKGPSGKTTLVAHQKFVRLGERRGDFVSVISGVSPGETVVSTGAFKLRNGMAVAVNNELTPAPELAPKPADN
jgi:membrane fusion protein, multidrug efflux system